MVFSIIQKSQLEGAKRLDAEYYQPEYLNIEAVLNNSIVEKIVELTDFVKKGIFDLSPNNYSQQGIPFVRVQNIKNGFLDEANLSFIPEDIHDKEKKTELRPFDIVMSKVGSVGDISIIPSHFPKANFSQNVIGLKIKENKIPKGFLALFLLSKFGQMQIERANMQQVQAKLELKDIRDLLIIRMAQKTEEYFHQEFLKIGELFENSKFHYSQAENLLLGELGLRDWILDQVGNDISWTENLSKVEKEHRMDAEYFQPKYEKLISKIKNRNAKLLGDLASMKKGVEPGSEKYEEAGKLFLRVSNVSKIGLVDGNQKYISSDLYGKLKKEYEPKVGEILLTKDATPGVAYVLKESVEGIIAGGILRLKLKDEIQSEYLALCINSIAGQMQVERDAGGSVIVHWKPEQIKNLLIPILSKPIQQKIADLVRQSHDACKKAKELLEEAKRKVEMMIDIEKTTP